MTNSIGAWTTLLALAISPASGQVTWLTDDQAREIAGQAIHEVYPEPCYSTYRNERLESFVLELRRNHLSGNRLNNSVYIYRAASDSCDFVTEQDGKAVRATHVTMDCCEYGMVAVDRITGKSYWFRSEQSSLVLNASDLRCPPWSWTPPFSRQAKVLSFEAMRFAVSF